MKTPLTLALFLLAISLCGQIADYRSYQSGIHIAELQLITGDKEEALRAYEGVLYSSRGNFIKDVFNAAVLASELGENDRLYGLLNLIPGKQLSNDYLLSLKPFKKHHDEPGWAIFLAKNESAKPPMPDLSKVIKQMAIDDQYFRTKPGSYKVYGDTIAHIDSVNMAYVLSLISEGMFPSEDMTGVKDVRGNQSVDILLHHYCQSTSVIKGKPNLTPALINLVLEGKLLPNKCANWLELQKGDFRAGVSQVMSFSYGDVQTEWYVHSYSQTERLLIDQTRILLGLEPLVDYYQKLRFTIENPTTPYVFDVRRTIVEIDETTALSVMGTMVKLAEATN